MMADKDIIAVVMGGLSGERDISFASGRACLAALQDEKMDARELHGNHDLAKKLDSMRPTIVFNALHGSWGEDGAAQGLFEMMNLAYTHSGVLASALAMHKEKARVLFAAAGLPIAKGRVLDRLEAAKHHALPPPYVVKPLAQGSSLGVFIVAEGANTPPVELTDENWQWGGDVLVEEYIAGREFSSALMGDDFLGVCEIIPHQGFYDYAAKYDAAATRHLIPAPIDDALHAQIESVHRTAHQVLGCRSVSRADFRYDEQQDRLALLEINTQPGMTPTSLLPELARHQGISMNALVLWITRDASCHR